MEEGIESSSRKRAYLKACVLLAFVAGAVYVVRFTPVKGYLTAEALGRFLHTAGFWAPFVFILVYTAGVCVFIPGTLLTALGAALFGAYQGFVYVWIGAMLGASISFAIGRTLGREFAESLTRGKLEKYDDAIERNGFATVLYLRLIYFPFTVLNFGMGLTKVRFTELYRGHRSGHYRRNFYFHLLYRNRERHLGFGKLGPTDFREGFFSRWVCSYSPFFSPKSSRDSEKPNDRAR